MAAQGGSSISELTDQEILHLAGLARLQLTKEQVSLFRTQLADVLHHVAKFEELDVTGTAPLAHPLDLSTRLDSDEPVTQISPEQFLRLAPLTEGGLIAVPKVLADDTSS